MTISENFRNKVKENDLDYNKTLFFCLMYQHLGDKGLKMIQDTDLLDDDEIDKLRIIFFDKDYDNNTYHIKGGLFESNNALSNNLLVELRRRLIAMGYTSQGHPNNRSNGIMQFGEETEQAIVTLANAIKGDIDMDILVKCIDVYYESAEMPMRLSNYLTRSAIMDYEGELIKRNRRRKEG